MGSIFNNKIEKVKEVQMHSVRAKGCSWWQSSRREQRNPNLFYDDTSFPGLSLKILGAPFSSKKKKKKSGATALPQSRALQTAQMLEHQNVPLAQAEPPCSCIPFIHNISIVAGLPEFLNVQESCSQLHAPSLTNVLLFSKSKIQNLKVQEARPLLFLQPLWSYRAIMTIYFS